MASPQRGPSSPTTSPFRAPYHRLASATPRSRSSNRSWPSTLATSMLRTLSGNGSLVITPTPATDRAVATAGSWRRGSAEAGEGFAEEGAVAPVEEDRREGSGPPRSTAGPGCPPGQRPGPSDNAVGRSGAPPAHGDAEQTPAEEGIAMTTMTATTTTTTTTTTVQPSEHQVMNPDVAAQLNRELNEENDREVALSRLLYSIPALIILTIFMLALVFTVVSIYISGWVVLIQDGGKPCDQPLNVWLCVVLINPFIQILLRRCVQDTRFKALPGTLVPMMLATGVLLHGSCKTCQQTNPHLYSFIRVSVVLYGVFQVVLLCFLFCFVGVLLWLQRHGLLQVEQGLNTPAKPGLIRDIESVPYRAEIFDNGPDGEPLECCICQANFNEEQTIKRTPCNHYFHEDCLKPWLDRYARSCPLCREDIEEALAGQQMNGSGSTVADAGDLV